MVAHAAFPIFTKIIEIVSRVIGILQLPMIDISTEIGSNILPYDFMSLAKSDPPASHLEKSLLADGFSGSL